MKFRFISSVLALLAASMVFGQDPVGKYMADRVMVKFAAGSTPTTAATLNQGFGATILFWDPVQLVGTMKIPGTKTVTQALTYYTGKPGVVRVVKSNVLKPIFTPNDPFVGRQYGLTNINAFLAWDFNKGSDQIKIAIIDTGIQMNHPDLQSKIVNPRDINNNDNDPTPTASAGVAPHGSHCAGIAAAVTNNGLGVAGTGFNCKIMPIKVFQGDFTSDDLIVQGIRWAIDHGARVISMSLGALQFSNDSNPLVQDIINEAFGKKIIVLGGAGNDGVEVGNNFFFFPADYNNVVSVAATDVFNTRASFSNFGKVDVAAPGVNILSTVLNNGFAESSGTSMACPMAAGVVGVMLSAAPAGTTATRVVQVLQETCKKIAPGVVLSGLVDMNKAVRTIAATKKDLGPGVTGGVYEGTALTSVAEVTFKDGSYYRVIPKSITGFGQASSNVYKFNIGNEVPRAKVIDVTVNETVKFAGSTTGQIYLLNWTTGKWDIWKSFAMTQTPITISQSLKSSFITYVSAAGEYRILLRGVKPAASGLTANTYDTDHVQSTVTYTG